MSFVKTLAGYRTAPHWPNRCSHEGYLFSFTSMDGELIDVFCWTNGIRQEFCLRFGSEDSEYWSPGGIDNIIIVAVHGEPYSTCLRLLREQGRIVWEPREC